MSTLDQPPPRFSCDAARVGATLTPPKETTASVMQCSGSTAGNINASPPYIHRQEEMQSSGEVQTLAGPRRLGRPPYHEIRLKEKELFAEGISRKWK